MRNSYKIWSANLEEKGCLGDSWEVNVKGVCDGLESIELPQDLSNSRLL